ncbi:MAG: low molecular weight phosphatase family protein [Thermoplasmata archaeon]|nr:low molecular weight phosphatase family protein [Thermoplasmata archaeon]
MPARQVLFVCVENAARSLMAESIFNADPPPGWSADSAGTRPALAPNPRAAPMLAEIGLKLPPHPPRELTATMIDSASIRVTMGCLDDASCPARLKSRELRDWALPDPGRLDDEGFRGVRDEIRRRVSLLHQEIVAMSRGEDPTEHGAVR